MCFTDRVACCTSHAATNHYRLWVTVFPAVLAGNVHQWLSLTIAINYRQTLVDIQADMCTASYRSTSAESLHNHTNYCYHNLCMYSLYYSRYQINVMLTRSMFWGYSPGICMYTCTCKYKQPISQSHHSSLFHQSLVRMIMPLDNRLQMHYHAVLLESYPLSLWPFPALMHTLKE